ncbi:TolC family protein [Paracnuella aquatica]|nr:TolC family protein [Paracnuella aquatica]
MKMPLLFCLLLCCSICGVAQEKWDLQRCVDYAIANNISIKQSDVQARIANLQLGLARAAQHPNVNLSSNAGYNFGRSINPATNTFDNQRIFFSGFQLQGGMNLFNWFSARHNAEASRLSYEASKAAVERARNDVALNVAVAYLQALLAYEQTEIAKVQIAQTTAQLENIRKQVSAGSLPELNAAELEAQLAADSANHITSVSTYQANVIQLKALLNLDMATPFDIETPDVSAIPVEELGNLQPQVVFQKALQNLPQQRANQLRFQAAQKTIKAARGAMYPTLSLFGNVGSRYSSLFPDQQNAVVTPSNKLDTLGFVEVTPGITLPAVRPSFNVSLPNTPFVRQLFDVNLSQAVGVSLSVPLAGNRQLRTQWERSKLDAEGIRLQLESDNLVLQQDIYRAHNDALNAMQRYRSAQKAVEAAEKAFSFSQKRFDVGLLQTIELLTNQNNLFRRRLDAASAQYEYVFRIKLLEFYKGEGLKL